MMATTSLFGFFSVLLAIPLLTTCSATPQAGSAAIGHEVRLERAEYTSANGVTVLPMDVYIPAAPSGAGVIAIHGGFERKHVRDPYVAELNLLDLHRASPSRYAVRRASASRPVRSRR